MKKLLLMFVMLLGSVATMQAQSFNFGCELQGFSPEQAVQLEEGGFVMDGTSRLEMTLPNDRVVGFNYNPGGFDVQVDDSLPAEIFDYSLGIIRGITHYTNDPAELIALALTVNDFSSDELTTACAAQWWGACRDSRLDRIAKFLSRAEGETLTNVVYITSHTSGFTVNDHSDFNDLDELTFTSFTQALVYAENFVNPPVVVYQDNYPDADEDILLNLGFVFELGSYVFHTGDSLEEDWLYVGAPIGDTYYWENADSDELEGTLAELLAYLGFSSTN